MSEPEKERVVLETEIALPFPGFVDYDDFDIENYIDYHSYSDSEGNTFRAVIDEDKWMVAIAQLYVKKFNEIGHSYFWNSSRSNCNSFMNSYHGLPIFDTVEYKGLYRSLGHDAESYELQVVVGFTLRQLLNISRCVIGDDCCDLNEYIGERFGAGKPEHRYFYNSMYDSDWVDTLKVLSDPVQCGVIFDCMCQHFNQNGEYEIVTTDDIVDNLNTSDYIKYEEE